MHMVLCAYVRKWNQANIMSRTAVYDIKAEANEQNLLGKNNQHKHSRTWHISHRIYSASFVHMCCLLLLIVCEYMLNRTLRACHELSFALQPKQVSPSQTPFQATLYIYMYRNVSLYLGIVLSFAESCECDFSYIRVRVPIQRQREVNGQRDPNIPQLLYSNNIRKVFQCKLNKERCFFLAV